MPKPMRLLLLFTFSPGRPNHKIEHLQNLQSDSGIDYPVEQQDKSPIILCDSFQKIANTFCGLKVNDSVFTHLQVGSRLFRRVKRH